MSDIDITPEILLAVADAAGRNGGAGAIQATLRNWAARLEYDQAEEKCIEELASTFWSVYSPGEHIDDVAPSTKRDLHSGIRAVLETLERDGLITDPLEAAEYQEKVLGITQEDCVAQAKGSTFLASYEVAPRPVDRHGDTVRVNVQGFYDSVGADGGKPVYPPMYPGGRMFAQNSGPDDE